MSTVFLQRRCNPSLNKCPRYGIKPSDGEDPVLELWEMWSTSLSYLPNPSARAGYDTRSIFLSGV